MSDVTSHRFCVAPMMGRTDRFCRYFMRLLTSRAILYTEMISTDALLHGPRERMLRYDPAEQPLALQLGGSEPQALADCAVLAREAGYGEINLNLGCPSTRTGRAGIGACLMRDVPRVADCVQALGTAGIKVSVKCRTGVDELDSEADFHRLVDAIAAAGCRLLIVHARKALLNGLSPKQNRTVPPLNYGRVYALKAVFPQLTVVINGGIDDIDDCWRHLDAGADGVMLGRAAYRDPSLLRAVDRCLYGADSAEPSREEVLDRLELWLEKYPADELPLWAVARHLLGLYRGVAGARMWRRHISSHCWKRGAGLEVLRQARQAVAGDYHREQPLARAGGC